MYDPRSNPLHESYPPVHAAPKTTTTAANPQGLPPPQCLSFRGPSSGLDLGLLTSPLHESYPPVPAARKATTTTSSPLKVHNNLPPPVSVPGPSKRVLLVCQAFPPLLKNAGGVAKRYLTLCRALIDGLDWTVTIVTPVNVLRSGNKDVERWLHEGTLIFMPARGVSVESLDGTAVFMDVFSAWNGMWLTHALTQHAPGYDVCVMDDVPWRIHLLLLMRAFGVPTVITSHTDVTHIQSFKQSKVMRNTWRVHMASAHVADVHASVSNVFGAILRQREGTPVNAVWPPILWSNEFRADPEKQYVVESKKLRLKWISMIKERDGFTPKVVFMFAGRWADEKRILLLFSCIPDGCALVVVGDGTSEYSDRVATGCVVEEVEEEEEEEEEEMVENQEKRREEKRREEKRREEKGEDKGEEKRKGKRKEDEHANTPPSTRVKTNVVQQPMLGILPLRKMLNATELRTAYQACDVFVSASAFETLGNTVVEALCCGTPVAVQPSQGHLEYVVDGVNSYFVNYDNAVEAKKKLTEIATNIQLKLFPPKLKELGKRFRSSNFALEFHDDVLQPAFDARARRDMHHNKCRCLCETVLIRPLSMIAWILLWLIMRIGSRCVYCCSKNPSFVILDNLGSSIENQKIQIQQKIKKKSRMDRNENNDDDLTTMRGLYSAAHLKKGVDLKKKKKNL